jgi:hypothetical protein
MTVGTFAVDIVMKHLNEMKKTQAKFDLSEQGCFALHTKTWKHKPHNTHNIPNCHSIHQIAVEIPQGYEIYQSFH